MKAHESKERVKVEFLVVIINGVGVSVRGRFVS